MGSKTGGLPDSVRFGEDFEVDVRAYELRSAGTPVKLKPIPMQLLLFLIERRGELVTRQEIADRIWGKDVFLDSDNGINNAISKIRQVLRDDPEQPRYVQTVTGRGYRFIAPVAVQSGNESPAAPSTPPLVPVGVASEISAPKTGRWWVVAGLALIALIAIVAYRQRDRWRPHPQAGNERVMLAILPFDNLTGDPDQDYFSDGLTEEVISQLGNLDPQHLGVIARTSVMQYQHKNVPLTQIARELGVQYVLEGSVRQDGQHVRIAAQLIQVKDQSHLWARQFDRELKEVLLLQGDIARETCDGIRSALGNRTTIAPPTPASLSTEGLAAYNLYLKGQYFWNKRTVESLHQAIDYYQQAIEKDPNYARAYAGLADSYALIGGYSGVQQSEFMSKAKDAALRAIALDDNLAEAHTALALVVQNYDYDWTTAEKEFRRAIALNPNYATAHHWYAEHLAFRGRFDEALAESERARQLDPLSLIILADRGVILYYARRYDEALEQFRAVRELDPTFGRAGMIMKVYVQKRMFDQAIAMAEKSYSDSPWYWSTLASIHGAAGNLEAAQKELDRLLMLERKQPVDAGAVANVYIHMGRKAEGLTWLEKALMEHSNVITTLKVEPIYDSLRGEARFQELLRRAGLAE